MSHGTYATRIAVSAFALLCLAPPAFPQKGRGAAPPAQTGRGGGRGAQAPAVVSPEVMADRRIAFRGVAPQAQAIRLAARVDLLKKHGFTPVFKESTGGHTWINWRIYLNEFTPQLFQ